VAGDHAALISFDLTFSRPIDLRLSLQPFGRWGDDGIDRWNGTTLLRTIRVDGAVVPFSARVAGTDASPRLAVEVPAGVAEVEAIERTIRATFVLEPGALNEVAAADEAVASLRRRHGGVVPVLVPDPFMALVRSISAQQVNLPWAATVRRRLAERYGTRFDAGADFVCRLEAAPLAAATVEELRAIQLTTAKSRSLIEVAQAAQQGDLEANNLTAMEDDELIAHLIRLRGIGRWSAEWFLARTLGRPRVVAGDLGVRKAVQRMYGTDVMPTEEEVRRMTAHWGSAATVIQALALHDLAGSTGAA
jgi:DNA-3-methyladenine glycosylase II